MDHHVHHQTARDLDVVDWRRRRVAADNRQGMRLADLAALDGSLDPRVIAVEAAIEADLQLYARLGDSSQRRVYLRQVEGDRFLAKDIFARPRGLGDEAAMRVGRGADDNRVNVAAVDDLGRLACVIGNAKIRRGRLGRVFVDIGDGEQVRAGDARRQSVRVDAADAPRADDA